MFKLKNIAQLLGQHCNHYVSPSVRQSVRPLDVSEHVHHS